MASIASDGAGVASVCLYVHSSLVSTSMIIAMQRVDLSAGLTVASELEGDDGVLHVEDAWSGEWEQSPRSSGCNAHVVLLHTSSSMVSSSCILSLGVCRYLMQSGSKMSVIVMEIWAAISENVS